MKNKLIEKILYAIIAALTAFLTANGANAVTRAISADIAPVEVSE